MSRGQAAKKSRPAPAPSKGPAKGAAKGKVQEKRMAALKAATATAAFKATAALKAATATKAKAKEQEAPPEKDKEAPETPDSPLPLLDLSDAAVKKMIKQAKKRGYVTHEQLNAVLPSEEVSSDQIEDIYAMLNEMGINVVEQEEGADDEEAKPTDEVEEDDDSSDGE